MSVRFNRLVVSVLLLANSMVLSADARSDGSFPGKGSYNAWVSANHMIKTGNEFAAHNEIEKALSYYKDAINTYPYDSIYYFNVGNAFSRKAQYAIAEESYNKATELEPDYFQAWLNLGHAIARQGRFLEAAKTLKRAAKLSQNPEEKAQIEKNIEQFEQMPGLQMPPAPVPEKKKRKKKVKKRVEGQQIPPPIQQPATPYNPNGAGPLPD